MELAGPFSNDLWTVFVLRIAVNESAIRSAVVSLAYIHEITCIMSRHIKDEYYHLAMQNYVRSIREVVEITKQSTKHASGIALVACVLFAGIESLQGHLPSCIGHLTSGMRIMDDYEKACKQDRMYEKKQMGVPFHLLRPIFVAAGIQMIAVVRQKQMKVR